VGSGSSGVRVATAASPTDPGRLSDRAFTDAGSGAATDGSSTPSDTGLAPVSPDAGPRLPLPATVAVVGDSLTLSATDQIDATLSGLGLDVLAIDGVESRRMVHGGRSLPPGVDAIDAILAMGARPGLWIIALGTNDVAAESGPDSFRDDVATVLRHVPAGAPVIWVDLWIRDRYDEVVSANESLRSVLSVRSHAEVADWFSYGDDTGIITRDGVHLTDAGKHQFAAVMADAVGAMFER
jgi:lysophospholipase L1-like esterase